MQANNAKKKRSKNISKVFAQMRSLVRTLSRRLAYRERTGVPEKHG